MLLELKTIDRFGDLQFSITEEDCSILPFTFGDIVSIQIQDKSFSMPFCSSLTDVLPGESVLCFQKGLLSICILNGDFATKNQIASFFYNEKDEVIWNMPSSVSVEMTQEKPGGYLSTLKYFQLNRTNNREDYESDEIFANFREVIPGFLFRSSTPVNSLLNRNEVVDQLMQKYHISSVLNLSDTKEKIERNIHPDSYYFRLYSLGNVVTINVNSDLTSPIFQSRLCHGLKQLLSKPSPYFVHCIDGKDRTGFVIFLLLALCGYSKEDIQEDYLKTYENYYHLTKEDASYLFLKEHALQYFFRCIEKSGNLEEDAKQYFLSGGLSNQDITFLVKRCHNNK